MRAASLELSLTDVDISDELLEAEREVQQRRLALTESLRVAGESGSRLATQVRQLAKPLVVGSCVVLVTAAVVVVAVAVSRSKRRGAGGWLAPRRSSLAVSVARGAGLWLLRVAARRVLEQVAARLAASSSLQGEASSPLLLVRPA